MHDPSRFVVLARPAHLLACVCIALAGCGAGGAGSQSSLAVGTLAEKPGGGSFFVDPNQGGGATRLRLVELQSGRLVDVHALDAAGEVEREPAFRELVIAESVQSDAGNFRLETNAITRQTRLIVLRARHAPDDGRGSFASLVAAAQRDLAPVLPRADDGSAALLSLVARNAVLVLRFDDVLRDDGAAARALRETVRLLVGQPPSVPFGARHLFDPNHGALVGGEFHATRVLVDLTVSAVEAAASEVALLENGVGLPPSIGAGPSAALRLPTRTDPGSGQFELLRGLSGAALTTDEDGPFDPSAPTRDLVRAFRAGNAADANNGFLLDLEAPAIVGDWALAIEAARREEGTRTDLRVDLCFTSTCRSAPRPGAALEGGFGLCEVLLAAPPPDAEGRVRDVLVRRLGTEAQGAPGELVGNARFLSRHDGSGAVPPACWVSFSPPAREPPATGVAPEAELHVRFSEALDPAAASPFDQLRIVRGPPGTAATPRSLVVATLEASEGQSRLALRPTLALAHQAGQAELYHAELGGLTDLAGNRLLAGLAELLFTLDAAAPAAASDGLVLRFSGPDELEPLGRTDLRGQILYDLAGESVRPRAVVTSSYPADASSPVPGLMRALQRPIVTPFSNFGSKLQSVWRYCDFGWQVRDESKYDLDVIGLSWAPFSGQLRSDFHERFEIRLAHSTYLPDEKNDGQALPKYPNSGLNARRPDFATNVLASARSPQKVVHSRERGYRMSGADLFVSTAGTTCLPYPLNRGGGPVETYTWRDTTVREQDGPNGAGLPLDVEVGNPLGLELLEGSVAARGAVPSFGLPLLMEFRCYPSSSAIGLNGCDVLLANNNAATPFFRSFSTGGADTSGQIVLRDPDLEDRPQGGFNPSTVPPGQPTPRSDNAFYIGQLDVVTRLSRAHTIWLDSQSPSPDYAAPVVLPRAEDQPLGTRLVLEFRGAHGFELGQVDGLLGAPVDESLFPFDAEHLDPYGELYVDLPTSTPDADQRTHLGSADFPGAVHFARGPEWTSDLDELDGARFVQVRLTFVGDLASGNTASLSALALAFAHE
jgi:hypothetical protein